MPAQLPLDFGVRVEMGPEAYFVSDANRDAYETVTRPELWPGGKLVVAGPRGSGKTHLARLFADRHDALILEAPALDAGTALPDARAVVVEDLDRLPPEAQPFLFHLHNRLAAEGGLLMMTAATAPARWPLTLPDLASRVQAANLVRIRDPDDRLLRAVILKHLQDRQLSHDGKVADYLVTRMDRSFDAAARLVAALDAESLGTGRAITRQLASRLLDAGPAPD